jgi:hypothetical protein
VLVLGHGTALVVLVSSKKQPSVTPPGVVLLARHCRNAVIQKPLTNTEPNGSLLPCLLPRNIQHPQLLSVDLEFMTASHVASFSRAWQL